ALIVRAEIGHAACPLALRHPSPLRGGAGGGVNQQRSVVSDDPAMTLGQLEEELLARQDPIVVRRRLPFPSAEPFELVAAAGAAIALHLAHSRLRPAAGAGKLDLPLAHSCTISEIRSIMPGGLAPGANLQEPGSMFG